MYDPKISIAYRPEVSFAGGKNFSKTPSKPQRFLQHVSRMPELAPFLVADKAFGPLPVEDFWLGHTKDYVHGFFRGTPRFATSNCMDWSPEFAESVRYTNASLCHAVDAALLNPSRVVLSPTGGFHHAQPGRGGGFCTFSGQVISAIRAYRKHGAVGAWIDLDGHFGNSIEDSRKFAPVLNVCLPVNINPIGRGQVYLQDLNAKLLLLQPRVLSGEISYIAFAHGADSHEADDLGGQLSTHEWLAASVLVYGAVHRWSQMLGRPIPLVLALFGGYREDDPSSVLALHAADLKVALIELAGVSLGNSDFKIKEKAGRHGNT